MMRCVTRTNRCFCTDSLLVNTLFHHTI
jgi:hypothetical protein